MRSHGLGSVKKRGKYWWVRYYYNGQRREESSRSERRADAQALLRKRLAEIHAGTFRGSEHTRNSDGDANRMSYNCGPC